MQRHIFLVILVCLLVWATKSMVKPGLFTSHDSESHVTRIIAFDEALKDGQFPPRWASRYFGGIGSPVLMLNYQLPYFIAEFFLIVTGSPYDAYKYTLAGSFIVSGILAYFAFLTLPVIPLEKSKIPTYHAQLAAFCAAFLYTWAPYRFLDIYVRGALGESFAFMFPPLILWAIHKKSYPLLIIGLSGLFLSHPVASAVFSALFLGYILVLSYADAVAWPLKHSLWFFFSCFFVAFMIAAHNLIPTLLLTHYTQFTPKDSKPFDHFPTLMQLLCGKWGYGFSTSDANDTTSFRIGYMHVVSTLCALFFILKTFKKYILKKQKMIIYPAIYVLAVGAITVCLMLEFSKPLWKLLFLYNFIDFPWRLLMVIVFVTAYSAHWFLRSISSKKMYVGIVLFIVVFNIRMNINHININALWPWGVEHYYTFAGTGDAFGEYASKWRYTRDSFPISERAIYSTGSGTLRVVKSTPSTLEVAASSSQAARVRLQLMYFPGWAVTLNGIPQDLPGQKCKITQDYTLERDRNTSGLIECALPPGEHILTAKFLAPGAQVAGNVISLVGLLVFLWILFRSYFPPTTSAQQL